MYYLKQAVKDFRGLPRGDQDALVYMAVFATAIVAVLVRCYYLASTIPTS